MQFSKTKTIIHIFGLLFLAILFINFSGNPPNGLTGAPGEGTCRNCHGGNNSQGLDGEVSIGGLPATVIPGNTYPISVTVSNPNNLSLRAGFQMVALNSNNENAGSMANPSQNSTIVTTNRTYHEHSPAMEYDSNRNATWTVDWTAPEGAENETITFYAVGNITDMDNGGNTPNDHIVFTNTSTNLSGGQPQGADLAVANLTNFPAAVRRGEAAFYNFDVVNQGNITADGEYDILMYLSNDANFSADDVEAGVVPTGNTPVGTISDVTGGITAPTDLPLGNYFLLIVIDANNTIAELDETNNVLVSANTIEVLPANNPITASTNTIDALCFGTATGSIDLTVNGGNAPFSYMWSNGATTEDINDVEAGTYSATITDNDGTATTVSATVGEPQQLEINIVEVINNTCPNESSGSITVEAVGGTPPYSFQWSDANATTGATITNLPSGSITTDAMDANGCLVSLNFNLMATDEEAPTITCPDDIVSNNCATVIEYDDPVVMDNCGVFVLELMTGQESGQVFPDGTTTVTYMASDLAQNTTMCSFDVTVSNDLFAMIDDVTDATANNNDGAANITITGGTAPYGFAWILDGNVVSTEEDPTNLPAGEYTLNVSDNNGCTFTVDMIEIKMTVGLNDPAFAKNIQLYPNPTTGALTVKTTDIYENMELEIVNLMGQVVKRDFIQSNKDQIDLQGLSAGNYFAKIMIGEEVVIKKVVVE